MGNGFFVHERRLIMGASIFTAVLVVAIAVFFGWTARNGQKADRERDWGN